MKARVVITLKRGILDPQGQAVLHAIEALGQTGVKEARIGKFIELELTTTDRPAAETQLKMLCETLLANTVIEEYRFELQD